MPGTTRSSTFEMDSEKNLFQPAGRPLAGLRLIRPRTRRSRPCSWIVDSEALVGEKRGESRPRLQTMRQD